MGSGTRQGHSLGGATTGRLAQGGVSGVLHKHFPEKSFLRRVLLAPLLVPCRGSRCRVNVTRRDQFSACHRGGCSLSSSFSSSPPLHVISTLPPPPKFLTLQQHRVVGQMLVEHHRDGPTLSPWGASWWMSPSHGVCPSVTVPRPPAPQLGTVCHPGKLRQPQVGTLPCSEG